MSYPIFKTRAFFADLALIAVGLFWGTSFALIKDALDDTSPANLLFLRFFLAWLLLSPLAWLKRRSFNPKTIEPGLICGFFLFMAFMTQAQGLAFTSASRCGFITGLNVVLVPLISVLLFRKLPSLGAVFGALVAFAGLYLLTSSGQNQGPFNLGDGLTLICAFFCAGHILSLSHYAPGNDVFNLAYIQFTVVAFGGFVWALVTGELDFSLSKEAFWAAIYLGLTCTVLGFLGQTWAQAYTSATRTAIILTLEPAFGAFFSYIWLGEKLGISGVLGGAMIIMGILLAELRPKIRQKFKKRHVAHFTEKA